VCVPARSALQTGRYPTQLGTFRNDRPLPPGTPTLAHHFKAAGYRTGYLGKWHLGPRRNPGAVPPEYRGGYDDWLAANVLELISDAYDCRLFDEHGAEHRLPGYRVDALTDAAIRYVATPRPQPFFLFVSYLEPHHQNSRDDYPAPDGYAARYVDRWVPPDLAELGGSTHPRHLAGYYGMVRRLDEALGRIYDALKSTGALEHTILLFTSDHGCHFKTRNSEYKRSCHESSIRVPTMFHGPGFMGGGDRAELVSLIDLPPTLLAAAGIPVPPQMQGRSLLPRLANASVPWRDDIFVQISEHQTARALRTQRWKYCVSVQGEDASRAVESPGWPTYAEDSLYDLANDPHELVNLAGLAAHARVAGQLRVRLLQRMAEAGEPIPVILPAPTRGRASGRASVNRSAGSRTRRSAVTP
jgi:arylsulfatase A-like enzyme